MDVCEQLRSSYTSLSKSQKKVADYLFRNLESAAMLTTVKIAIAAGVSETTVIRLAYALGYDSFKAMQKQMRSDLLAWRRVESLEEQGQQNEYQKMLSREISLLMQMRDGAICFDQLQNIAARIAMADHVMVFGYYGEHTAAYQLYFLLDAIRPNVHYFRENNVGLRELAELNPKSVVIAMAFRPYCPGTLGLVEQSRDKGPYVVGITDSALSPLARLSDETVVLSVAQDPETKLNGMASAMAYGQVLMAAVKNCIREEALYRVRNVQNWLVQPGTVPMCLDAEWDIR